MIPISDELPTLRRPWMTWAIIAVTLAVWFLVQGGGMDTARLIASTCNLGMVPGELTHLAKIGSGIEVANGVFCVIDDQRINVLTPLISIFLHGSWAHIGGNMLFFYVFGNNIEDSMGPWRFLLFYLLCGLAAGAAHILTSPASPVPTVGASGAISGIMGAYLLLFPRVRVRLWFPPIFVIPFRAWMVLIWWFVEQVIIGLPRLNPMRPDTSGGVAVWAHVGGFLAGMALIHLFTRPVFIDQLKRLYHQLESGRAI